MSEPRPTSLGFRIIPCSVVDFAMRASALTIGLVISARIDPRTLEATLSELVEHKFSRAGARVAYRSGVYELQIPEVFDSQTPPFIFTVDNHPEIYHGDGRPELPNIMTGSKPCVMAEIEMKTHFAPESCPKLLTTFLERNGPLLHVHVSVFDDITFLGITAPHIALDAIGGAMLLTAWTRLLSGEDMHAIPGMAWDAQPFALFNSGLVKSEVPHGWFKFSAPQESHEEQELAPPAESDPKDHIMDELKGRGSTEYVSSSDTVYSHRSLTDQTPIHLHVFKDLRELPLFANDAPLLEPYIHNAISTIAVGPIPASAFQTESLGQLALRLCRAILAYTTDPEAIRADLRWQAAESNRLEVLCPCPPCAEYSFQTNWRSARLAELDFSGAVTGNERGTSAPVMFVYPLMPTIPTRPQRGLTMVLMEDADAVWMWDVRGERDWERIRQASEISFADSSPV
ncbi:hypothetical protein C8R45DRAFT_823157 [Mycena sanguinolenta]|nr:hypothetical protein C8R45DRAFT_823157 [Mycena sanguinolenta]